MQPELFKIQLGFDFMENGVLDPSLLMELDQLAPPQPPSGPDSLNSDDVGRTPPRLIQRNHLGPRGPCIPR